MKNYLMLALVLFAIASLIVQPLFAQYGDGSKIGSALDKTTDWLTKVLGGAMVVIGMIIVGIRMSLHDEKALQKGIWVLVGGLLIFLSKNILDLIKSIAGF